MGLEEVRIGNLAHRSHRSGWLRASVLGSNDGLVSTASLMIGVSAAQANDFLITAGLAGIAAGAMSMAVGEYVSVRSQNDIEAADRQIEMEQLKRDPAGELEELTEIYIQRGLSKELALQVATTMSEKNALEAHLRDELGQYEHTKGRPIQAGFASAISFTVGGAIPFMGALAPTPGQQVLSIIGFTILGLLVTGYASAKIASSPPGKTILRIFMGGALGMIITAGIGSLVHLSGI
jgi:VIT1/CCC1 family predicted Fe2+/Mn2+ transporter